MDICPGVLMKTSTLFVTLKLNVTSPKMIGQANLGMDCPDICWANMLSFHSAPYFINLTALRDEAIPGTASLCQCFPGAHIYVKQFQDLGSIYFARHVSIF